MARGGTLPQSGFIGQAKSGSSGAPDNRGRRSVAINVVVTNNKAYLDANAVLTLDGSPNVTIEADSKIKIGAKAYPVDSGVSGGSGVGVGASVAFNYGEDTTAAYIDDGAMLTGAGAAPPPIRRTAWRRPRWAPGEASGATRSPRWWHRGRQRRRPRHPRHPALTIGGDFRASSTLSDSVLTSAGGHTAADVGVGIDHGIGRQHSSKAGNRDR